MNKAKLEEINNRLKEMLKNDQDKKTSFTPESPAPAKTSSPATNQRTHVIRRRKGSPDKRILE